MGRGCMVSVLLFGPEEANGKVCGGRRGNGWWERCVGEMRRLRAYGACDEGETQDELQGRDGHAAHRKRWGARGCPRLPPPSRRHHPLGLNLAARHPLRRRRGGRWVLSRALGTVPHPMGELHPHHTGTRWGRRVPPSRVRALWARNREPKDTRPARARAHFFIAPSSFVRFRFVINPRLYGLDRRV